MAARRPPYLPSTGVLVGSVVALTLYCMFFTIVMWLEAVGPAEAAQAFGRPLPAGWEAGYQPKPNSALVRWRLGSVKDHPVRFGAFVAVFIGLIAISYLPRFTRRAEPKPVPLPGEEREQQRNDREAG